MHNASINSRLKNTLRIDRALKFVWQASPVFTLVSVLLLSFAGFLPLLSLYLIKLIIDAVTQIITAGYNNPEAFYKVLFYIALTGCVGIGISFFNLLASYAKKAQSITLTDYMSNLIHQKSVVLDLSFYESNEYKDTLHRAQSEGPSRPVSIVENLFSAGQNLFSAIAVLWLLCFFNPVLGIVLIISVLPGILLRLHYAKHSYNWQLKRTQEDRKSYYLSTILTTDTHAKEIRLFDLSSYFISGFNLLRATLKSEKLSLEKKRAIHDFLSQSTAILSVFGALAYIAYRTVQGGISIGDMVMYFQAYQRGLAFLKSFLENISQMYEDNLFLSNLYEFLNLKPRISNPEFPKPMPDKFKTGIEFKNVNFFYQNCEKNTLNCVNFSIHPGEIVALVGENGSGKSTVAKLLTRLYDPSSGSILLEGVDIREYDLLEYRKKISVLFQDYIKYYLSFSENIFLGNVHQKDNNEKIVFMARQAGIHDKIVSFDRQYQSILGKWFLGGEELSTGQYQMVAIARTLFKEADFLILDEPSSALDPKAEKKLFSVLRQTYREKAVLIITHRSSTVRLADRILVIEDGKIIEQGPHDVLIEKKGAYTSLFEKLPHY